jgi:hypothetical protein
LGDGLFRHKHPVSRDDASIPNISFPAVNSTTIRTHLVRILHLPYKTASFPWKNEGSGTTLATHWTTHQGPRQLARNAKELGKPGFLAERTGFEQPAKSLGKSKFKNEAAQNPTRAAKHSVRCLLHARAAALSWTLNRLLAHPHITGSFTR